MPCAACGSALPTQAKFCPNCGAKVVDPEPASAPAASAPTPRQERRLLTVLFGDLVGFTSASDGADPEDIRARVRPFQDLVRREVARTGGTVARVVGDGVMVVWGYPTALEDDAPRAIRAALAIRDGVPGLGADMHVRLGINSGEAVVTFGSDDERADDAMGDSVNVAARLASAAPIDGIVVGESTATLAGSRLRAESLAPLTLKGKAEPVPAFLVLGLADDRMVVGATRFVGRSTELSALRGARASAETDRGLVRVLLTGEPGIGKSRLIAELRRDASVRDVLWLTGRCRPDAGAPGWALGEIVKTLAGIGDDDTSDAALVKLEAIVPTETPERGWVRDRLAQLAGAMGGAAPSADELGRVWAAFLGAIAAGRTVVVQIEDLHWADTELLDVLTGSGFGGVRTAAVLLLSARPEVLDVRPDLAASCQVHLALLALAADDGDALVASLAEGLGLAPEDRLRVVARSGGNPLFATELVRLLAQGRPPAGGSGRPLLPETVQAVIAARLDLLSAETRAVARDAAVVGANFWRGAVAALGPLGGASASSVGTTQAAFDELIRLEFIRPRRDSTLPGDAEYAFRHALVRDVAYGQLTRADRAVRHALAASWLADRAGPDRGDLAGIVADHDLRALDLAGAAATLVNTEALREHAWTYLMRAGRFAASIDVRAAVERYRAANEIAARPEAGLEALVQLAAAESDAGNYVDAVRTAERAMLVAVELGDGDAMASLHLVRGRARRPSGDVAWSDDVRQALDLLDPASPSPVLIDAYAMQTLVEMIDGSGAGLLVWADKAIAAADLLGIPPPAGAIGRRGFARAMLGDRGGEDDLRLAIDLARASGDSVGLANAVSDLGGAFVYRGDTPAVEAQVRECLEITRVRGLRGLEGVTLYNLAHVERVQGRFDEALATLDAAEAVVDAGQDRVRPYLVDCERAFTFESRGDIEAADALVAGLAERVPGATWTSALAALEVLAAARREDPVALRHAFERVYLQEAEDDLDPAEAITYLPVARAAISVGATDVAEAIRATISAKSAMGAAILDGVDGLVLAASGALAAAHAALGRAIAFWDAAGFRPEGAEARMALAASLASGGGQEEAGALLRAAGAAWSEMAAPRRAEACLASLADLEMGGGVTSPAADGRGLDR
jgi:class 3 adenylate cyclase/tetratricopeptide (TPR) repeat protein